MNIPRMPNALIEKSNFGFFDDFLYFIDADLWTKLAADAGSSVAIDADGVGGRVDLTTGATDNNEADLATTNELFLVAVGKPLFGEAKIKYAEANTDDANVAVGFSDALGANLLVDNGGHPKTTGNHFLIYKIDGETVWTAECRNGTTTSRTKSTKTAGGTAFQTLRVEIGEFDADNVEVTYYVDDEPLKDSDGKVISHRSPIASATEMDFGVYVKAGSANSEVVTVDHAAAYQVR